MSERPKPLQDLIDQTAQIAFGRKPSDVPGCCVKCAEPFSDKNVFTPSGWRETKISQLCERCWDTLFQDVEDWGEEDAPM